ncbi:transcriptional regulator TbsP [Salinarchaeum laminariae]|uniref:transcriptional regulator TbsP n=1 Tax=Salinarchaeum laminariae TaxID=869888 RepID=UPI0020C17B91|nr:DUF5821 family protein [Salinarchaeum laminariae]
MESNLLGDRLDDILRSVFSDAGGELVVVNPTRDGLESLIDVAAATDDLPAVRVLVEERTLKDVMDDFIVASNAAVLIEDGILEFRTVEDGPENALLVTEDRVVAIVDAGTQVAGLVSDEAEFVSAANERYESDWAAAEEYSLRTPSIERVRETLSEDIGADAEADFTNILASLETARGDGDGLDEVTISLLVAAKNEALLYDISKWGEDIGIASKATFSRTKTKLEDKGLLDTEKVPIDVGRPRLRLKLGDERLQGADNGELASAAQSLLA